MHIFPFVFIPLHVFHALFPSSFPLLHEDSHPDSQHSHPYSPNCHGDSCHSYYSHPIPRIPILIPCILTLFTCILIIILISFSDSPLRLLQITKDNVHWYQIRFGYLQVRRTLSKTVLVGVLQNFMSNFFYNHVDSR